MEIREYCTQEETEKILQVIKNPKHRAQILLMNDAGLRVSEVCELRWSELDFRKKTVKVQSLKKRGKEEIRYIPMSTRLYQSFAELVEKKGKEQKFIFTNAKGEAIKRNAITMLFRRIEAKSPEIQNIHPHKLRHTFATNLRAAGAEIEDIKDLLGHRKLDTTMIYAHADPTHLRNLIESSQPKPTFFQRLKSRFLHRSQGQINIVSHDPKLLIGRADEVRHIEKQLNKGVSLLIVGEIGVGKSHIINNLKFEKKVLELDDVKDFKKSVTAILLYLFQGDKDAAAELIFNKSDRSAIETKISRESVINLCQLLKQITEKNEYILKIGDIDQITPSVVKALEVLKEHFQIITTARSVKIPNTTFMWDFEKIEIKPLTREDSLRLFHRLTDTFQIDNLEFVRNRIYDTSEGNPRIIVELSERIGKESYINGQIVDEICLGYLGRQVKEIDMSLYLFLIFGSLVILRQIGREANEESIRFIGSCIMIVLLFARFLFNATRRRAI
jgi:integrase/recombinase XerD